MLSRICSIGVARTADADTHRVARIRSTLRMMSRLFESGRRGAPAMVFLEHDSQRDALAAPQTPLICPRVVQAVMHGLVVSHHARSRREADLGILQEQVLVPRTNRQPVAEQGLTAEAHALRVVAGMEGVHLDVELGLLTE